MDATKLPQGTRANLRGIVQGMEDSFQQLRPGLSLSLLLVYLVLVAQFQSFLDPFLILLAVPTGMIGVLLMLFSPGPRST